MRYLVVDTAYWKSISNSHTIHADKRAKFWSVGASYAAALSKLDNVVSEFYCANYPSFSSTSKDGHGSIRPVIQLQYQFWQAISRIPVFGTALYSQGPVAQSLIEKVKAANPDVILMCNANLVNPRLLKRLASPSLTWVAVHSSQPPPKKWVLHYSHVFSALPPLVEFFKGLGVSASYLPLAFPREKVIDTVEPFANRSLEVSFVGTLNRHFLSSISLFRKVAKAGQLNIFSHSSPLWFVLGGLKRYLKGRSSDPVAIYSHSRVVINRHIKVARGYSANLRMFEAAVAGALLLTEASKNLHELFKEDVEVITYSSPLQAAEKVRRVDSDLTSAEKIAEAGRRRVLTSHLYEHRAPILHQQVSRVVYN